MGTQRTKAALDALFADNTSRQITPARLRDFLESCIPSTGGLHFDDPGTPTTIAVPSTYVKAANTSTLHDGYRFSMPVSNRLRYDGVASGVTANVMATLSFTCATNNQTLGFAIAVNGVISEPSKQTSRVLTGTDVRTVTIMSHPILAPGDYVEVWVANLTSTASVTVEHGHVYATGFMA